MTDTSTVDRHPGLAALLGMLAPGLGLLYVGRGLAALGALAIWLGGSALAQVVAMQSAPQLLWVSRIALSLGVLAVGAVAAVVLALRPAPQRGYQHWWWLFGFFFLSWAATTQLQTRVVARHVGFAIRAPTDAMAPAIAAGTIVVVDPNGAALKEDVVVVLAGGRPQLARVIAVAGQVVRVEGGRASVDDASDRGEREPLGVGCDTPITTVAQGQLFVLPDQRDAETCAALPRLVPAADVLGRVVRPLAKRAGG